MGKMQQALQEILLQAGSVTDRTLPFPTMADVVTAGMYRIVHDVYRSLGGLLPVPTVSLRKWDMEFEGLAVELDEYLHFNRYRAITLRSPVYSELRGFPLALYRQYCVQHEDVCLRVGAFGGKWSNPSCERQFGQGSSPRNLGEDGAPRWKQRAFYDFVKDLSPLLIGVRIARISAWDLVSDGARERTVAEILCSPSEAGARGIVELVRVRAGK